MVTVLLLLFFTIGFVVVALWFASKSKFATTIVFSVWALILLLALVFFAIPVELGFGRVPYAPESFERRLEAGVVYKVLAIKYIRGGDEAILLVWAPLNDYRAIRVKARDPIPVHFTLINGVPREVK